MTRLSIACYAVTFAGLLACVGPALNDLDAARDVAAAKVDAQRSAQRVARMEAAARVMCRHGWRPLDSKTIQCVRRRNG